MKKWLVFLVSAALVLSLAAVSMAAVTVKGDFRYEFTSDDSVANTDYQFSDLRFAVEGPVSDTVTAYGLFQLKHDFKNSTSVSSSFDLNEYYVTYKKDWGSVKAGFYEYKFTPSRVLLKSGNKHVWDNTDVLIASTFKTPVDGLTFDFLFQPYAQNVQDDGSYGLSFAYNASNFGVKATYADFKNLGNVEKDLFAWDIYFMLNDTMKLFANAVDYNQNKPGTKYSGIDPVVGFAWDKIGGSGLYGAVEYALNARNENSTTAPEFDEYTVNLKYKFTDKTGLEIEHYEVGKGQDKNIFRLRYQF